ncbi:alcohol dehydrogenase [Fusarium oxysporum f. sp. lycopersici MN25]|nr:alcohol dehydrogenase [Fusarium oxysporum f. sp. lycopersici MN25]
MPSAENPIVLHIGDPIKYNHDLYKKLESKFTIIRPSAEERQRGAFLEALHQKKWGDFQAVMRPFWITGGEMGRWDKELIPLLPKSMKVYASAGAGYDWADVDIMAENRILYCNGAAASTEAVSDMALYHIISVFRNMQWSNMAARGSEEEFRDAHAHTQLTASNPRGHTLGIIGLGNIGYQIALKTHKALGMRIAYYDPFPKPLEQEAAIEATNYPKLEDMLAIADCIVIAAPGAGGNKILGLEEISKMKKGSRLVNVARGSLVDEEAVADAMDSGHLFAVGLDVFEDEPRPNPRLQKMRNATLTCHTAGGALDTSIGFERLAMENVMAVLEGKDAITPVNKHLFK